MEQSASRVWFVPTGFKRTFRSVAAHKVHALKSEKRNSNSSTALAYPIILLHGALASRRYLMPTAKVLAKHLEVYVYEMPGHGGSSKPPSALPVEE